MKTFLKATTLATASVAALLAMPSLALAQAAGGVAVADLETAVARSNAYVLAENQIKTTYKANFDQVGAIKTAINPLLAALDTNKDRELSQSEVDAAQAAKRPELAQIDAKQREANNAALPIKKAQAYAQEQIGKNLEAALKTAMQRKNVSLVLNPQAAVYFQPSVDITNDVIAALNVSVPQVGIVPPAGWGTAPKPGAAPAAPAPTQPQGR